jgi:hypothetical protein
VHRGTFRVYRARPQRQSSDWSRAHSTRDIDRPLATVVWSLCTEIPQAILSPKPPGRRGGLDNMEMTGSPS